MLFLGHFYVNECVNVPKQKVFHCCVNTRFLVMHVTNVLQVTHTIQMFNLLSFFMHCMFYARNNQGCTIFIQKMSCMGILGSTRMCTKQMSHCFVLIKDYKGT